MKLLLKTIRPLYLSRPVKEVKLLARSHFAMTMGDEGRPRINALFQKLITIKGLELEDQHLNNCSGWVNLQSVDQFDVVKNLSMI